jgi:hypothetical protein
MRFPELDTVSSLVKTFLAVASFCLMHWRIISEHTSRNAAKIRQWIGYALIRWGMRLIEQ